MTAPRLHSTPRACQPRRQAAAPGPRSGCRRASARLHYTSQFRTSRPRAAGRPPMASGAVLSRLVFGLARLIQIKIAAQPRRLRSFSGHKEGASVKTLRQLLTGAEVIQLVIRLGLLAL